MPKMLLPSTCFPPPVRCRYADHSRVQAGAIPGSRSQVAYGARNRQPSGHRLRAGASIRLSASPSIGSVDSRRWPRHRS
jgi:hypothetical protein